MAVLGALEVARDGWHVAVPAGKTSELVVRLALEAGCSVAIDTDAHAPGHLDWQHLGCERAHLCGVRREQVVNAWDVDALLSWTGRAASAAG